MYLLNQHIFWSYGPLTQHGGGGTGGGGAGGGGLGGGGEGGGG